MTIEERSYNHMHYDIHNYVKNNGLLKEYAQDYFDACSNQPQITDLINKIESKIYSSENGINKYLENISDYILFNCFLVKFFSSKNAKVLDCGSGLTLLNYISRICQNNNNFTNLDFKDRDFFYKDAANTLNNLIFDYKILPFKKLPFDSKEFDIVFIVSQVFDEYNNSYWKEDEWNFFLKEMERISNATIFVPNYKYNTIYKKNLKKYISNFKSCLLVDETYQTTFESLVSRSV
jgi:hypothetical protein